MWLLFRVSAELKVLFELRLIENVDSSFQLPDFKADLEDMSTTLRRVGEIETDSGKTEKSKEKNICNR